MSKKIHATKTESAASVIGRVLNSPDDEVVLYVPKGATFGKSRNDFLLLKREVRVVGKVVTIESVDDDILELAATSGFRAENPFLGKKQKAVADIVSVRGVSAKGSTDEVGDINQYRVSEDKRERSVDVQVKEEKSRFKLGFSRRKKEVESFGDEETESAPSVLEDSSERRPRKRFKIKWSTTAIIGGVLALIFVVLSTWVFPRASVYLELQKRSWAFVGSLNIGTNISANSFEDDTINLRGMRFSEKKNFSKTYESTGSDSVERSAKGIMTVYNAYSSEPQELVERTRFQTPDGKVYRMDKGVIVPGANVVDGKITPSSVDVSVTADEPGEEYNIGPVPKFRIPGFLGSPKYDGFYGETKAAMTGGFVGERKIATESDKASAREDITKTLEESAKADLFINLPHGVKVMDETYRFEITEEVIDEGASDSSTFSITLYGEASVMAYSEEELLELFEGQVENETGFDLVPKDHTIEYGEPRFSESGNSLSVAISVDSTWTRPLDVDGFRAESLGKNREELENLMFSIPGIESGRVNFWPFWIGSVPERESRVFVDVN